MCSSFPDLFYLICLLQLLPTEENCHPARSQQYMAAVSHSSITDHSCPDNPPACLMQVCCGDMGILQCPLAA